MPKYLEEHINSTNSINFQVIAGRGKGKSTMVREILQRYNRASNTEAKMKAFQKQDHLKQQNAQHLTNLRAE